MEDTNQSNEQTPEIEGQESEPEGQPTEPTQEPSLEEIAKAYNMTPAQVIKSYGEAQKKITRTSQELSDYRRNMQWAEQFRHEISTRKGLREHIENFFEEKSDVPPEVKGAIDPIAQRLAQVEADNYSLKMNAKLDEIGQRFPLDADTRQLIFEEVSKTGNPDVEAHYWKLQGPKLVADSSDEIKRASLSAKNRDAYVPNRGTPSHKKGGDIKGMSKDEWSNALDDEISGLFRRTE